MFARRTQDRTAVPTRVAVPHPRRGSRPPSSPVRADLVGANRWPGPGPANSPVGPARERMAQLAHRARCRPISGMGRW